MQSLATSESSTTAPSSATAPTQPATAPTVVMLPPEPRVPTPERFSGNQSIFRTFHNACQLYFSLQPQTFSLEATKVGFIISLLQGEPQTWAHRLLKENNAQIHAMSSFFDAMAQLYDDPQSSRSCSPGTPARPQSCQGLCHGLQTLKRRYAME